MVIVHGGGPIIKQGPTLSSPKTACSLTLPLPLFFFFFSLLYPPAKKGRGKAPSRRTLRRALPQVPATEIRQIREDDQGSHRRAPTKVPFDYHIHPLRSCLRTSPLLSTAVNWTDVTQAALCWHALRLTATPDSFAVKPPHNTLP